MIKFVKDFIFADLPTERHIKGLIQTLVLMGGPLQNEHTGFIAIDLQISKRCK